MQQLVPLKIKLWLIVGLGVLVSAAAHAWAGQSIYSLGGVVGVVELVIIVLMLRSWHWLKRAVPYVPFLPVWMKVDLTGERQGQIHSQWKKVPTDPPLPPIPVQLNLRQTWEDVVFIMDTDKMHSRSSPATPFYDRSANELQFRYFFETNPTAESNQENPPQQLGSAMARIDLRNPNKIKIKYTNERGPGGDIVVERVPYPAERKKLKAVRCL
jgi:SMODS-associating 2TM, beta-strand rich effector domain